MRVPGLKSLRRSAIWLTSRFVGRVIILGYHRVASDPRGSYGLSVSPQHFTEQLEALRHWARPISLRQMVQRLEGGDLPRRAVVVTFDDGYSDNLHNARPLLERYDIPATVFVTTGLLGRECWWDELDRLFAQPEPLPARLDLTLDGATHRWEPEDAADKNPSKPARARSQDIATSIYRLLFPLSPEACEEAMDQLRSQFEAGTQETRTSRVMTGSELSRLAEGDLVEIGAHSVTHPVLTALSPSRQDVEIRQGKADLEELLGRPVTSFSYPNGSFSDHTRDLVKHAGYSCACASFNDVVSPGSDRFALPRFWVPDWNGERFSRWLRFWLPG